MSRWVCTNRTVHGEPESLRERLTTDTVDLLLDAMGSPQEAPAGDGSVTLRIAGGIGGTTLHAQVHARVGEAAHDDGRTVVPLSWTAAASPVLPRFTGTIELVALSAGAAQLTVAGQHHPPLGPLGDVADAIALHGVAQRTIEWVADQLAAALTHEPSPHGPDHRLVAADVLSEDPVVLDEQVSVRTAAQLLLARGFSGAPVVDASGHVVGVLSIGDLMEKLSPPTGLIGRRAVQRYSRWGAVTVGEACTRPALTTQAETPLHEVAGEMIAHDVDRLVVMRGATLAGIVSRSDVARALIRADNDLEDAGRSWLRTTSHDDVGLEVEGGIAHVHGTVATVSDASRVRSAIREIDGVLDVESHDLIGTVDDTPIPIL